MSEPEVVASSEEIELGTSDSNSDSSSVPNSTSNVNLNADEQNENLEDELENYNVPSEYRDILLHNDEDLTEEQSGERLEQLQKAHDEIMVRVQTLQRELLAIEDHNLYESVPNLLNRSNSSHVNTPDAQGRPAAGTSSTAETKKSLKKRFTFDTYLQTTKLFEKHGTLPSTNDWGQRLKLLRLFYPHMVIEDISMRTDGGSNSASNDSSSSYLQFDIFFPKFFRFQVLLDIEKVNETVHSLAITILEGSCNEMSQIKGLIQFCEQRHDVSLFMYSMHSYVSLWKNRITTFSDLYDHFLPFVDINGVKKVPKGTRPINTLQHKLFNFTKFKTETSMNFTLIKRTKSRTADGQGAIDDDNEDGDVDEGEDDDEDDDEDDNNGNAGRRGGAHRYLLLKNTIVINWRLDWKLGKGDLTGECFSFVDASLFKRDTNTNEIVGILDLTETLNEMIISDGVYAACTQLIDGILLV